MAHPLEFLAQRYGERVETGGIVMIANIASLRPTWMQLTAHMDLRRATLREAEDFQRLYNLNINSWKHRRNPFTTRANVSKTAQGWHADHAPLPESEFRYHVIEFRGTNGQVYDLRNASALTDRELHLGMDVHYGRTAGIGAGGGIDLEDFVDRCSFDDSAFEEWDARHAAELSDTYRRWRAHDENVIALKKATESYMALRRVKLHPNLLFLGLFTMLESLLTVDDRRAAQRDMLRNQVVSKVALLEKRFCRPLPYETFRGTGAPPSTIWHKLYTVRSILAHGRVPDFSVPKTPQSLPLAVTTNKATGEDSERVKRTPKKRHAQPSAEQGADPKGKNLETLVSLDTCERFVRATLKSVMRCALYEPQLVADLQLC
jgi:hypothetical protein